MPFEGKKGKYMIKILILLTVSLMNIPVFACGTPQTCNDYSSCVNCIKSGEGSYFTCNEKYCGGVSFSESNELELPGL